MSRPTIVRQSGQFVLHDLDQHYHVILRRKDLSRLIAEASGLLYVDLVCEAVIPPRAESDPEHESSPPDLS